MTRCSAFLVALLLFSSALAFLPMFVGEVSASPSSYDLSTQPYFPPICNQRGGDCAAWAMTYYAFGYLEAKKNGWTDTYLGTDLAHLMSPSWTFNRCQIGGASLLNTNARVIYNIGCADQDVNPYTTNLSDMGTAAALADAGTHKASYYKEVSYNSSSLAWMKSMISSDIPLTFAMTTDGFVGLEYNTYGDDNIIVLSEYNYRYEDHAQCIVGYNDSRTVSGEPDVGAFKVANSYGTSFQDDGYYWISYDVINFIGTQSNLMLTYVLNAAAPDPWPSITSTPVYSGTAGTWYQYQMSSDMMVTWTMSTNAAWLSINTATKRIFGTPPSSGTFRVVLTATSSYGTTAVQMFDITVVAASGGGGGSVTPPPVVVPPVTDDNGTVISSSMFGAIDSRTALTLAFLGFVGACGVVVARNRRW